MTPPCIYALLGGSFDPIHRGHLAMAQAVDNRLKALNLSTCTQTALLPSRNPFKQIRHASDHQRLTMLRLAVHHHNAQHNSSLCIDDSELALPHQQASYTQQTLTSLKQKYPNTTLIFIIGQDSLNTLPTWQGGLDLLGLCHFWVFARPPLVATWDYTPFVADLQTLVNTPQGHIYLDDTPIPAISSTTIRQTLAQGDISADLIPCVQTYITKNKLYLSKR